MTRSFSWFSAMALVLTISGWTFAQTSGPNDGILLFSTHEWGIDLASSAVHLSFPLRSKAGKIPYSSSVEETNYYSVVVYQGNPYWALWPGAPPFYGPAFFDTVRQSSLSGTVTSQQCNTTPPFYYYDTYTVTSITDGTGATHPLQHQVAWVRNNNSQKCVNHQQTNPVSSGVNDNSGYTLYANTTGFPIVYDKTGYAFTVPVPFYSFVSSNQNFSTLADTVTDPDGATISGGSSSGGLGGAVTDTLNTSVLQLTGGGTGQGALETASYTDASGSTQQQYTMGYTLLPLRTNFGCSPRVENSGSFSLLTSIQTPTGASYTISYEPTHGYSGYYTGRVSQITFPTGGSISYAYSDTSGHNGMDCSNQLFAFVPTIAVTVNDNNGSSDTYTYAHSVPPFNSSNFTVRKTDPAGNQTVYTFDGEFQTQVQYYQGSATGTPLKTVLTCYNRNTTNCANPSSGVTLPITQTDVYSSLGTSASNHVKTTYDGVGNVTSVLAYDFGASSPTSQTFTFYGQSWNGTSCTPYPTGIYIANTPCYSHTENSAGTDFAKTQITYSNTGHATSTARWTSGSAWLTSTATFNLAGTLNVATDASGATLTYAYNGTGGCNNLLATSVTVKGADLPTAGLTSSTQWDCNGGVVTQSTDANGQPTNTNYAPSGVADPLYRPLSASDPVTGITNLSYAPTTFESALNFNGTTSTLDGLVTIDGLGRTLFGQKRQGQGLSTFDSTQTAYGWISATTGACTNQPPYTTAACTTKSVPYSGTAGQSAPSGTAVTTTQYDALGRPLIVTDGGGGTVSYSYVKNDVLEAVGPTQTFQRQLEYDGLGRLTRVCEITSASGSGACGQANSASGFLAIYTYNVLGNLLTVTQNAQPGAIGGQQSRTYTYDGLGRLISETNPESGTTTYSYDSNSVCWGAGADGNLHTRTDNAGNVTCYLYDALHRMTDAAGWANNTWKGPCRRFRYDASTNGVVSPGTGWNLTNLAGRLVEVETDNCIALPPITDEWFSYDARGQVTDTWELTPHSGGYYHTQASYWPTGKINSLSALSSNSTALFPTISYGAGDGSGLDGEGRVTKVTASSGAWPAKCCIAYSSGTSTAPLGALTSIYFGSTDLDSFTYDPNTGRMATYTFSVNGKSDTGTLTWNPNGTLQTLAINDLIPGTSDSQTCNYLYDDLQRLSTSNCGALWTQNFTYDAFGNASKSGTGSFLPNYSATTNQFTSIPGITAPYYDSNGNLIKDNLNTYTWDPNWGNMVSVNTGSTNVTATYDALGRMVENSAGGTTEFIYSPTGSKLATVNGATLVEAFVPLPSGATAIYNSTGLAYYRHSDWVGSSRLTSTQARGLFSSSAYAPFGEQYAPSGTADASFTGQNSDTVSSLYDFPFRENSPTQGRWISPDPAGLGAVDPSNPQTWNRYAYVGNSPLTATDPLGLSSNIDNAIRNALNHAHCPQYALSPSGFPCGGTGVGGTFNGPEVTPTYCFIDGMESDCSRVALLAATGAAAFCPDNDCKQIRQDPDTGDWLQVTGWQFRNKMDSNGNAQPTLVPIWGNFDPVLLAGGPAANNSEPPISRYIKRLLLRPWSFGILLPFVPIPAGFAGNLSFDLDKGFACLGGGFGVGARGVNGGPLWGDTQNSRAILSGLSVSVNVAGPLGAQVIENPSGRLYGPTGGAPGASVAVTYSGCTGK